MPALNVLSAIKLMIRNVRNVNQKVASDVIFLLITVLAAKMAMESIWWRENVLFQKKVEEIVSLINIQAGLSVYHALKINVSIVLKVTESKIKNA